MSFIRARNRVEELPNSPRFDQKNSSTVRAQQLPKAPEGGSSMKANYSSKKLGGYILALFLILGFTTIASTSVQAQWRDRDRDDQYRRDRDRDDRYQRDRDYRNRDNRYGRNGYGYETARQQGYSYGVNVGGSDRSEDK